MVPALLPLPPMVVTVITPVLPAAPGVAVIWVFEFTAKASAGTPPKVTDVAPVKLFPRMVTGVLPPQAVSGEKLLTVGGEGGAQELQP